MKLNLFLISIISFLFFSCAKNLKESINSSGFNPNYGYVYGSSLLFSCAKNLKESINSSEFNPNFGYVYGSFQMNANLGKLTLNLKSDKEIYRISFDGNNKAGVKIYQLLPGKYYFSDISCSLDVACDIDKIYLKDKFKGLAFTIESNKAYYLGAWRGETFANTKLQHMEWKLNTITDNYSNDTAASQTDKDLILNKVQAIDLISNYLL